MEKLIFVKNNQSLTTSLLVAESFDKEHKHVLRDIREILDTDDEFNQSNFGLVNYTDAKGEERPMYHLTKDGFTLLVMGYTGEKAMAFKKLYIQKFNAMDHFIQNQLPLNTEQALVLALEYVRTNKLLTEKIEQDKHKVDYADNVLVNGKSVTMTIYAQQLCNAYNVPTFGVKKLYACFRELGLVQKGKCIPTQRYVDNGYLQTHVKVMEKRSDAMTLVTPTGQVKLADRIIAYFSKKENKS